jgi:hypothetical protein
VNISSTPDGGFQARSSLMGLGFSEGYILHADREPCPICGHPTGDCVGSLEAPDTLTGWKDSPEGMRQVQMIFLEEDVWEERQITAGRKTKILKHRAGTSIPFEEAKNLGLV